MRIFLIIFLGSIAASSAATDKDNLAREVRHEVLLVPGYTVFDWLAYRVDNGKVTLLGSVVRAELKRDVENAVKKIEHVQSVQNGIEVLPVSASDDRIRHDILLSIDQQMSVYLSEEVKRIHIIVKNGNVTLEGEVSSQSDKDRAAALAKHVQNVHDVSDDLVIQK
jgi:hyperosmotically inducible periplasmic protein